MTGVSWTLDEIEDVYRWAGEQLGVEHLSRRDLATIESELTLIGESLEISARRMIAEQGHNHETALLDAALQAVHGSLYWLHLHRRYARVEERREQLQRIQESSLGAVRLLRANVPA